MKRRAPSEPSDSSIDERLKNVDITISPSCVKVPISTRGIGLMAVETFNQIKLHSSRLIEATKITPLILYKIGLLQLAVQIQWIIPSYSQNGHSSDSHLVSIYLENSVKSTAKRTFMPFSLISEIVGRFTYGNIDYVTFVPPLDYLNIERSRTHESSTTQMICPHPYRVTAQNARATVVALADKRTPQLVRQYFRKHNPIPGAKWNDSDDLLQNPDELFPEDWLQSISEINCIYMNTVYTVEARGFVNIGSIPLDGTGDASSLVSQYQFKEFCIVDENGNAKAHFNDSSEYQSSSVKLGKTRMAKGALAFVGEYPEYCAAMPPEPTILGMRHEALAAISTTLNWHSVFNACGYCDQRNRVDYSSSDSDY